MSIESGEDIAHLGELDQKLWTVLSCPVDDLEFDAGFLKCLDADGDGVIRAREVVAAAQWLCSCLKDRDTILRGEDFIRLDNIAGDSEPGRTLLGSARQILSNLGLKKDEICVADCSDSVKIFAGTRFNGDGIITPESAGDEELKALIKTISETTGSAMDRSGTAGVTAEHIEAFYTACAEYAEWLEAGTEECKPYGDLTAAALAACEAVDDKVRDFFTRCSLLHFDAAVAAAVTEKVDRIDEISTCPIAAPNVEGRLPLDAVNPAWHSAFSAVSGTVLGKDFPGAESISGQDWDAVMAKFGAYRAWMASKKGDIVESLGAETVSGILKAGRRDDLLDLVAEDKALEAESDSIDEVCRLVRLHRDFAQFLRNFVVMSDFYKHRDGRRAIFEAGRLYIDQRCCEVCLKVNDMGRQADMPGLSGMFLLYCDCTDRTTGARMDIVAIMTEGPVRELRPGKNGVFYDRSGKDWDATVTRIVDNPISLRQAFWDPYRKFWNFCIGLIDKSAGEKEAKMNSGLQSKAAGAMENPAAAADGAKKGQGFDIAKFAGIFAALGLALGYIGSFIMSIITGVKSTPVWQTALILAAIMLLISGPSCFIAWSRLRKRNLGPVLNANGWAINSKIIVNIPFGRTLTSVASYPKVKLPDPYRPGRKDSLVNILIALVVLLIIGLLAYGVYLFV